MSLVRRYQPQILEDLVDQPTGVELLRRIGRQDDPPPILITGPHGVGKTTAARILALALNCTMLTPYGSPCLRCDACQMLGSANETWIYTEVAAGLTGGKSDAQSLDEIARVPPLLDVRHRVIFIDEAHMLSRQAQDTLLNAFETPGVAVFVLATTEPHLITGALRSRCQHVPLRLLSQSKLIAHGVHICSAEGIVAEPGALELLANAADGHMRDFLMSLDQLAVGGVLRTADVAAGLDLEWANVALRTLIALAKGDHGAAKTSLREWTATPQIKARALRDGLVHVAHIKYTDRREHPEGTAAFLLASPALVDELADALGASPGGFGVQPLAYILALAEQWSRCAPHLHDQGDLDMELLRATHALSPTDASLPPIPTDPFVAVPPRRVRRPRVASTALPKTSKSRPEFLTKKDVAAEYRAATMLPQEYGIWFNARLKLRYADHGIVDVTPSLKVLSEVTHELRLRLRDWIGDPAYQLHYVVQNEVDEASCLTSWLLMSVPLEHLMRTREWLTTKLPTRPGELMQVLGKDVWRAPSIARPASLHGRLCANCGARLILRSSS
jgi:DNA polymerase III subunit gamma/tau